MNYQLETNYHDEELQKNIEKNFEKMNDMQRKAILHINGPLLILAGAGSGKTTVLVNRIAHILCTAKACYPGQVLAITFTNKAAGELKERLCTMLGQQGNEIWASTFHSTCARILRRDGERIGFSSHFTIYDTDDSKRLMRECQKAVDVDEKILPIKVVLSEISHAKDNMIDPQEYEKYAANDNKLQIIAKIYQMYQKRLKESDAMDFDDLICNTVYLFERNPDVLEYYQDKFLYLMVDEYQDTNHAQYLFVKLLAQKRKNICVVGDDDQSIYKFRGATIENIMSFEESFPNAKVIRLEQNYRSTQNILDAANAVISNNVRRKGKTLWTRNGAGEKISIYTASSEQDEAAHIAKQIAKEVANGRKYSDFAVLYRMNFQSNILERVFVKSEIPYRIIGGMRFYERKEIKDMLAYLSVINNPADEIRLRRIINQPKRAIGEKTISQAEQIAQTLGESLFDVICRADEFEPLKKASGKLKQFASLMLELIEASEEEGVSLNDLYHLILEKTNYILSLNQEDDAQDRIDNIKELSSNLIHYEEENPEGGLSGFLEEVSLFTDIDNFDASANSVTLMTMHSAKGLEFPVVFVPGVEDGIFPGVQAIYNPEELEEERRLAYVAITRAKEELYLLNSESRMVFGTSTRNKSSRFLGEIPEELVERSKAWEWKKPDSEIKPSQSPFQVRMANIKTARSFGPAKVSSSGSGSFHVGDTVMHKTFGTGTVISASAMGNDTLLEIVFDKVGTKKIMANFARLTKK